MRLKTIFSLIVITAFSSILFPIEWDKIDKKMLAKDVAYAYVEEWAALFAHETVGHALASNLFEGDPVDVHFSHAKLFTLGKKPFTIHSIFPCGGWAHVKPTSRLNTFLISIAGPIAGALTYFLINLVKNKYQHNDWPRTKLLTESFVSLNVINELLVNLIPSSISGGRQSDGAHAIKALFPSLKKTIDSTFYGIASQILVAVLSYQLPNWLNSSNRERAVASHKAAMAISNKALELAKFLFIKSKTETPDISPMDCLGAILLFKNYPEIIKIVYGT